MVGLLFPALVATAARLLLGGSLRGCTRARIAWWPLLLAMFALELVLFDPPIDRQAWALAAGPWIWVASKIVMLAVLARNAQLEPTTRFAWLTILLGVGLNTLAIVANGGHMPQSMDAAAAVWGAEYVRADTYSHHLENVAWMQPGALLPWLCDVLAEPSWLPRPNVLSVGDVTLALGAGLWLFRITTSSDADELRPRPAFGERLLDRRQLAR